MYFFIADEHYGHWTSSERNIIKYCNRPFDSIEEMDAEIIKRFNSVVSKDDITIHAGDFTLKNKQVAYDYLQKLNGDHLCLQGSHDRWLPKAAPYIWQKTIENQFLVVCHYSMHTWHRSHYNSFQLYGHSHGKLAPEGKQHDIGVDNNNFYPVSFDKIVEIMKDRPDNFNLIKGV